MQAFVRLATGVGAASSSNLDATTLVLMAPPSPSTCNHVYARHTCAYRPLNTAVGSHPGSQQTRCQFAWYTNASQCADLTQPQCPPCVTSYTNTRSFSDTTPTRTGTHRYALAHIAHTVQTCNIGMVSNAGDTHRRACASGSTGATRGWWCWGRWRCTRALAPLQHMQTHPRP